MKKLLIVLFALLFVGCIAARMKVHIADANWENLSKLSVGMTKKQASRVMRDRVDVLGGINSTPAGASFSPAWTLRSPYKIETVTDKDGKSLEVRYYVTSDQTDTQEISDKELTPLVFENDKLAGWGQKYLDSRMK